MTFAEFIALLHAKGLKPRQLANGQWLAHCPAHDDAKSSLSVTENDGRILLHCFAGCPVDAVCAALAISVADLFLRENNGSGKRTERIIAVYDYHDASGRLLFQTGRYEPKRFAHRQPADGKWCWTLEGIPARFPFTACLNSLLLTESNLSSSWKARKTPIIFGDTGWSRRQTQGDRRHAERERKVQRVDPATYRRLAVRLNRAPHGTKSAG
jgi:hypothetical protein